MNKIQLLTMTSVSLLVLSASFAEAKPGKGDTGKDKAAIFAAIDSNGDGKVTAKEFAESKRFQDATPKEVGRAFAEKDLDGDGAITAEEFASSSEKRTRSGKGKKGGSSGKGGKGGKDRQAS